MSDTNAGLPPLEKYEANRDDHWDAVSHLATEGHGTLAFRVVQRERQLADALLHVSMRDATLSMAVARLGGMVEGGPTSRVNFLQRIDELVEVERRLAEVEVIARKSLDYTDCEGECDSNTCPHNALRKIIPPAPTEAKG